MEGLLNFIISVQLTFGPLAAANELKSIPESARTVVYWVYLPLFVAYNQSPTLEVAIDEIVAPYVDLASGWKNMPAQDSQ
jgi:hypothetical protein